MARRHNPTKSQKAWLVLEKVMKDLRRSRPRSFFPSSKIATECNRLIRTDSFFSTVPTFTSNKVSSRLMTWSGVGLVQEKIAGVIRRDPMQRLTKKGPIHWRWNGGRKKAYIPGHPDYGDDYFEETRKAFRRRLRRG